MASSTGYDLQQLLGQVIQQNASDLHLQVGQTPVLRVSGEMEPLPGNPLTPEDTRALVGTIIPAHDQERLDKTGGADFAISYGTDARFRVSVMRAKGEYWCRFPSHPQPAAGLGGDRVAPHDP